MVSLEPVFAASLAVAMLLFVSMLWMRRRHHGNRSRQAQPDDNLDTVQAWPPQLVRVMTLPERRAYELLRRALPRHLVLAQVPLSRFISVPTRYPYVQWLNRAGRLNVDLLVCDSSSRAIAAVEVRPPQESARSAERHARLANVLRAAGVAVHVWQETQMPNVAAVRKLFGAKGDAAEETEFERFDSDGRAMLPVPEIRELLSAGDGIDHHPQGEPVSSDYFDDLAALPSAAART
jgi:hypothetical protein